MSMSDPIADLLTRIRNAVRAELPTVTIPGSNEKREICRVLKEEGFIEDFNFEEDGKQGLLHVKLKYLPNRAPVLQGLRRVSKPSLRVYAGCNEIKPVRSGLGIAIISTSKGVMTGKKAHKEHIGGEIICEVW